MAIFSTVVEEEDEEGKLKSRSNKRHRVFVSKLPFTRGDTSGTFRITLLNQFS